MCAYTYIYFWNWNLKHICNYEYWHVNIESKTSLGYKMSKVAFDFFSFQNVFLIQYLHAVIYSFICASRSNLKNGIILRSSESLWIFVSTMVCACVFKNLQNISQVPRGFKTFRIRKWVCNN